MKLLLLATLFVRFKQLLPKLLLNEQFWQLRVRGPNGKALIEVYPEPLPVYPEPPPAAATAGGTGTAAEKKSMVNQSSRVTNSSQIVDLTLDD